MDSLYQRLKEMDSDTFQRFCAQLLKERHPEQEIRHVEGAAGDEGLDVFVGQLSSKPAIWQCKAFANGVGESQKEQIRESLRTALKNFSPSFWILCLSVDLDAKASRWFEKFKASYAEKVTIGEMFATEIVNELLHHRNLRNHFFPNASLDVTELRRLAARTGEMSVEDLERITDANLEDIIEHWESRDARFKYQIVFDTDLGPQSVHAIPPGLVMSISQPGGETVNVFARDVTSLEADPPKFAVSFRGSGIKKYEAFVRTGVPQEFEADELGPIKSDWPLMKDMFEVSNAQKMKLGPSPAVMSKKKIVRLDFASESGTETVRYNVMELREVRRGTDETEYSISSANVPFKLNIVITNPPSTDATFEFDNDWVDKDPKSVRKSLNAFNLLRPSGKILVFDAETDKLIIDGKAGMLYETPQQTGRRGLINDVADIADKFGVELKLPAALSNDDLETIYFLKQCLVNGELEISNISTVLGKSEENKSLLPQQLGEGRIVFKLPNMPITKPPSLFGTPVNVGPLTMEGEADVVDFAATLQRFQDAAVGTGVKISFRPTAPVRVSLSSAQH